MIGYLTTRAIGNFLFSKSARGSQPRKVDRPEIHSHITNGLNLRDRAYRLDSEGKYDAALEVMRLAVQELHLAEKLVGK